MGNEGRTGQSRRRRLIELVAVLMCAGVMVMLGSSLAASGAAPSLFATGPTGPTVTGPTGPTPPPPSGNNGQGNPSSNVNPAGHIRKRKCKKNFRGNRKHRKCRKKRRR